MRRTLAIGVALLAGFVLASPAGAATPTEKKLTRQVAALQKQVKALQKDVKDLETFAGFVLNYDACSTAVVADTFQTTWSTLNGFAARALFPVTTPQISDQLGTRGACERLQISRQPTTVPPTVTVFDSLVRVFR